MCSCVHAHICVCTWKPEVGVRYLSQSLIETAFLPEPGDLTRASKLQEFFSLCLSSSRIKDEVHATTLGFSIGGNQNSSLHAYVTNIFFLAKSSPQYIHAQFDFALLIPDFFLSFLFFISAISLVNSAFYS